MSPKINSSSEFYDFHKINSSTEFYDFHRRLAISNN